VLEHDHSDRVAIERWEPDKPLVSVVIPCYNYGEYLEDAVASVLAQTLQDFEILVVNDGSTEPKTLEVLNSLPKPKTQVIHQDNKGLPAARNKGIAAARGKYICPLDADDMLGNTYLEKVICLLEAHPDLGFAYSWVRRFGLAHGVWRQPAYNFRSLLINNHISASAVFRKSAWEASRRLFK
jgi:glycosyltransferase involved in cell wall biosynthesis